METLIFALGLKVGVQQTVYIDPEPVSTLLSLIKIVNNEYYGSKLV